MVLDIYFGQSLIIFLYLYENLCNKFCTDFLDDYAFDKYTMHLLLDLMRVLDFVASFISFSHFSRSEMFCAT